MHCLVFRNVTNITGLFFGIPLCGEEGSVSLIVPVSRSTQCSARMAVCSGPGEEELCNGKMFLSQSPHPYFKLLDATDSSSLG